MDNNKQTVHFLWSMVIVLVGLGFGSFLVNLTFLNVTYRLQTTIDEFQKEFYVNEDGRKVLVTPKTVLNELREIREQLESE